jgi:hypothetical protein
MSQALFERLRQLNLPEGDFAIFGSGPLLVRGVIAASNDLDVICRGAAWERVNTLGELQYLEDYDVTVVSLDEDTITFGTEWGIGDFDVDELIDRAELIDGLPFVQLESVIQYKEIRNSETDQVHLAAIAKYAAGDHSRKGE